MLSISEAWHSIHHVCADFYQSNLERKIDMISAIGWRTMPVATGIVLTHLVSCLLPNIQNAVYFTVCGAATAVREENPIICFLGPVVSKIIYNQS